MEFRFQQTPSFLTLSNGLRIALFELSHLHSVGIGLYVKAGSRYEHEGNQGISHFLEHVLFRGNERFETSKEMNLFFESLGGSFNAYTSRENLQFYGKLHPNFFQEGLQFFADFLQKPLFQDVDTEREIILEERLEDVNEDGQDIDTDDLLRQAMWPNHPCGRKIIGIPETLKAIKQQDLIDFFQDGFVASNMLLCLTGSFQTQGLEERLESLFSFLPTGEEKHPVPVPSSEHLEPTILVNQDSSQTDLLIGFLGPAPQDKNYWALGLLEGLLDGGMSSILWQKIVEEQGICYELWSQITTSADISTLDIGGSVAPEKAPLLVEAIFRELSHLQKEGPTQQELELAKKRWAFQHQFLLDHVNSLNEVLGCQCLYREYKPWQEIWEYLQQVKTEDIQQLLTTMLTPGNFSIVAVGPLTKSRKRKITTFTKNPLASLG